MDSGQSVAGEWPTYSARLMSALHKEAISKAAH